MLPHAVSEVEFGINDCLNDAAIRREALVMQGQSRPDLTRCRPRATGVRWIWGTIP